jgi:hypothetical protein
LAALCANAAYRAFLSYQAEFHIITRPAVDRFLRRDWLGAYADAAELLGLYSRVLHEIKTGGISGRSLAGMAPSVRLSIPRRRLC